MGREQETGKRKFVLKVPNLSGNRMVELAERIKPVMEFKEQGRCYIKPVDIFAESSAWDPEPAGRANGLKPLCDITTYHPYGYNCFFKPSIRARESLPRRTLCSR